jgi:hypothetical protein
LLQVFRDFEVRGSNAKLEKFVVELGRSLPNKWKRDRTREEQVNRYSNSNSQIAYHIASRAGQPAAHLFLWRDADKYVISNIVPITVGQLTRAQYNSFVEEFRKLSVLIAENLGLEIRVSSDLLDISEHLTPRSMKALTNFERNANRGSLHPLDSERWRRFLILAHKDNVSLASETLTRWFVEEQRWPEDRAVELAIEFEFALQLLKDYDGI